MFLHLEHEGNFMEIPKPLKIFNWTIEANVTSVRALSDIVGFGGLVAKQGSEGLVTRILAFGPQGAYIQVQFPHAKNDLFPGSYEIVE